MKNFCKHIVIAVVLSVICSACDFVDYYYDYTPTLVAEDPIINPDSEYIVVIGDIQEYTANPDYYEYLGATMDWILSQYKYGAKIKCILQTGDLTWSNVPVHYDVFLNCAYPVAGLVPYVSCTGNHDYDWNDASIIGDRNTSLFSQYTSFDLVKAKLVAQFEPDKMDNIIVSNFIHNQRYDIISLEFGPREEVVQWVINHVQENPDVKYILMTHEYLTHKGNRISTGSSAAAHFISLSYNTPEQLWQKVVRDNDNIVCVLCGHNGFSQHSFASNSAGRDVAQILFNLQYLDNGGDGWIQLWEFPADGDYVNVDTYNVIKRRLHTDAHHSFQFKYKY